MRLLHLLQMLGELPATCRFVHVCTPSDIAGISPHMDDIDIDTSKRQSPAPAAVHDWVLAVFIHECIVHKVLDYELAPMHCSSPACMMMQVPLEARHDLSQLVADGLIATHELTSSRLAASTISGSPYTSGTQRGGKVRVLVLTPDGQRISSLLLRTGSRELRSIITADTDGAVVPRRVLWHSMRLEFLLCEAPEAMPIDPITGVQSKPPRFRSPLPLPGIGGTGSPLRSPVTKLSRNASSATAFHVEPLTVTRALRSSMTLVRKMIPSFVISPCVPLCLVGHDINNIPTRLRASNRALALYYVELLKKQKATAATSKIAENLPESPSKNVATNGLSRAIELAAEAEALNELATVSGIHGVQVFITHWVAGMDAGAVHDLNARLMASDNHTSGAADRGGGVGSSLVWDDEHNAARTWRSASEMHASGPGETHIVSRPEDIDIAKPTASKTSGGSLSPGGSGGGHNARMVKSSPSSPKSITSKNGSLHEPKYGKKNKYLTPKQKKIENMEANIDLGEENVPSKQQDKSDAGYLIGARILEVLGARGVSGRTDLRCVFTAETIRHDSIRLRQPLSTVPGRVHLGEMCISCGKDGSVICSAAIDSVDDRIVFAPSSSEASTVGSAGRYSGDRTSSRAPGVSLDKLSKTIAGLQINAMDLLRCVLLDNNDPSSERATYFSTIHGDRRAEPCGYVSLLAGSIRPFMKPAQYLDGSEYEIRLIQLIGRVSGGAFDVGLGGGASTLFIGERGTLLVTKRPQRFHASLIEHAQWKSREIALDAMQAQADYLGACISRLLLINSPGSNQSNIGSGGVEQGGDAPLNLGDESQNPRGLLLRISHLISCVRMIRESLRSSRESSSATEPGPGDDEGLPVWEDGESQGNLGSSPASSRRFTNSYGTSTVNSQDKRREEDADGRPGGVATAYKETFSGSDSDILAVRELRRVLEIRGLRASVTHRAESLESRLIRLQSVLSDSLFSLGKRSSRQAAMLQSGSFNGINSMAEDIDGPAMRGIAAGSSVGKPAASQHGFNLGSGPLHGTVCAALLSALVAFALFDTLKDQKTQALPWEDKTKGAFIAESKKWTWLGLNIALWAAILVVFLVLPICLRKIASALRCTCCGLFRGFSQLNGRLITINVSPVLRIDIAEFERQILKSSKVIDDTLRMPRYALNSGQPAVTSAISSRLQYSVIKKAGIGSGDGSRRVRRGIRVVVFSEPVTALGLSDGMSSQWKGCVIVTRAEIRYDGSQHGGATLQDLRIDIQNAPHNWPYRWLHELILIKWLDRLDTKGISTPEDLHVVRQVLRLGDASFE